MRSGCLRSATEGSMALSEKFLRRTRTYSVAFVLLLCVIIVGFDVIYVQDITVSPAPGTKPINETNLIFYLGTMPAVSIVQSILELLLLIFIHIRPTITLAIAVASAVGWLAQACFWTVCEVGSKRAIPSICPQSPLTPQALVQQGGFEAVAKNLLVWVVFLLYAFQTVLAMFSIRRERGRKIHEQAIDEGWRAYGEILRAGGHVMLEEREWLEESASLQAQLVVGHVLPPRRLAFPTIKAYEQF